MPIPGRPARATLAFAAVLVLGTAGCTSSGSAAPATAPLPPAAAVTGDAPADLPAVSPSGEPAQTTGPPAGPATSPSMSPATSPSTSPPAKGPPPPRPPEPRAAAMLATVRTLAGFGPREATGTAFRQGAVVVERAFRAAGLTTRRQAFSVPAGSSWGVDVDSGRSFNVVGTPPGWRPDRPYSIVGAHLDTVPQAPGAEDNASGVAVVLELARLAQQAPPSVPVVLVAFGAEEPRGPGDALHHFGSRHYVRTMGTAQRANLVGMLSLDRVGVGPRVPVGYGGLGSGDYAREVRALARRAGVPTAFASDQRTSDHWSFEKADLPAARLGSTPYDEYHSARDVPGVVSGAQLRRTAEVAWAAVNAAAPR